MKKILYLIIIILLVGISLCACSVEVVETTNELKTIGVKNAVSLDISSDISRFLIPKSPSDGVYQSTGLVIVNVKVGAETVNRVITTRCYYKRLPGGANEENYSVFYAFYIPRSSHEIVGFSSQAGFERYLWGNDGFFLNFFKQNSSPNVLNDNLFMAKKNFYSDSISTGNPIFADNLTLTIAIQEKYEIHFDYKDTKGDNVRITKIGVLGDSVTVDFTIPELEHATFTGWDYPIVSISRNAVYTAQYIFEKLNLVFYDYSNKELSREQRNAYSYLNNSMQPPEIVGLTFLGWSTEYFNKDKIIDSTTYKILADTSLYATYSGVSVMPGPGQDNPLFKACEWWDFGQHLINFVGWLLFDMPIIKDIVGLINSLIAFFLSFFGFMGVFAPMGFVGTLLIGVFGLFFLFKAIF